MVLFVLQLSVIVWQKSSGFRLAKTTTLPTSLPPSLCWLKWKWILLGDLAKFICRYSVRQDWNYFHREMRFCSTVDLGAHVLLRIKSTYHRNIVKVVVCNACEYHVYALYFLVDARKRAFKLLKLNRLEMFLVRKYADILRVKALVTATVSFFEDNQVSTVYYR